MVRTRNWALLEVDGSFVGQHSAPRRKVRNGAGGFIMAPRVLGKMPALPKAGTFEDRQLAPAKGLRMMDSSEFMMWRPFVVLG